MTSRHDKGLHQGTVVDRVIFLAMEKNYKAQASMYTRTNSWKEYYSTGTSRLQHGDSAVVSLPMKF